MFWYNRKMHVWISVCTYLLISYSKFVVNFISKSRKPLLKTNNSDVFCIENWIMQEQNLQSQDEDDDNYEDAESDVDVEHHHDNSNSHIDMYIFHKIAPFVHLCRPIFIASHHMENLLHAVRQIQNSKQKEDESPAKGIELYAGEKYCRICFSDGNLEELQSLCNCKGSLKYVHLSCHKRWLRESNRTNCEVCQFTYSRPVLSATSFLYHIFDLFPWLLGTEGISQVHLPFYVSCQKH